MRRGVGSAITPPDVPVHLLYALLSPAGKAVEETGN